MDLCKTRAKKSSSDTLNFNVALVDHEMVTGAGRATTCRCKIKPYDYKQNVQKMEGLPKVTSTEKPFDDFRQNKNQFLAWTKKPRGTHAPKKQQFKMVLVNSKK